MVGAVKRIRPAVLDDLLGDAQRREGLARPAGHDKAASIMVREAGNRVLDRFGLERPRLLHRALGILLLDLYAKHLPEVDLRDLGMGVHDRPLRVRSPPARRDDPPQAKQRLLRAAQEFVYLAFREDSTFLVALALDGYPLARVPPRHEINPNVATVESGQLLPFRPVGPAPDRFDLELGLLKRDPA